MDKKAMDTSDALLGVGGLGLGGAGLYGYQKYKESAEEAAKAAKKAKTIKNSAKWLGGILAATGAVLGGSKAMKNPKAQEIIKNVAKNIGESAGKARAYADDATSTAKKYSKGVYDKAKTEGGKLVDTVGTKAKDSATAFLEKKRKEIEDAAERIFNKFKKSDPEVI